VHFVALEKMGRRSNGAAPPFSEEIWTWPRLLLAVINSMSPPGSVPRTLKASRMLHPPRPKWSMSSPRAGFLLIASLLALPVDALAQTPPSSSERKVYAGLHEAATRGNAADIRALIAKQLDPNACDAAGRTPLHVAAFGSHYDAVRALVEGGGDINALENDRYDVITIAAVKDDVRMVRLALGLGGNPRTVTSRYDGTALIAAAHLGHDGVVQVLIDAGAPLDHVNNLGWTALIEAVVLGDGGPRHVATAKALVAAGASKTIADRGGITPLGHAKHRGYEAMVSVLR
jgi:ankyrin repeat protein